MPINLRDINPKTGHFELYDDNDNHVGPGRAVASHIPGFVTLTLYNKGGMLMLRVPINWVDHLEGLEDAST